MKDQIEFLTQEIDRHNQCYYIDNDPLIPDSKYDAMFRKLLDLEQQYPEFASPNSPTKRVGSDLSNNFKAYNHPFPMRSINSVYSIDDCVAEITKTKVPFFSIEHKFDGAAIELHYKNGELFRALTRGNGTTGEDVTDNIRTNKAIPLTIPVKDELVVRGEVVVTEAELKRFNKLRKKQRKEPIATARALAAWAVMAKTPALAATAKTDAVMFELTPVNATAFSSYSQVINHLTLLSFKAPAIQPCTVHDLKESIEQFKKTPCHYPTDGIVIKVGHLAQRNKMGWTSRYVRWAWALKEVSSEYTTPFTFINYQISEAGKITPSIEFKPIKHLDTKYKSVKLSWSQIEQLKLSEQSILKVSIKGNVTAQINGAIKKQGNPVLLPTNCPCCKEPLQITTNDRRCVNELCPEKKRSFDHMLHGRKIYKPTLLEAKLANVKYAAAHSPAIIVHKFRSDKAIILYSSRDQLFEIFRKVALTIY